MTPTAHRRLQTGETLLIATHNAGKLREMRELLAPHGIAVLSAADKNLPAPAETGHMFAHNAAIKAHAAAQATGLTALADDSGLCVDVLDGAPGIFSADWAGEDKNFMAAMERIEQEMHKRCAHLGKRSKAHFVSALVLAWPDGHEELFEGRVYGSLVWPPRGTQGFGYDPVFLPQGETRTFGEMSSQEKHGIHKGQALSHRAQAFLRLEQACLPRR